MSDPCIITVAITGSVARKSHNPAVPESVSEQIESTHEAFEAGASLVHVHSRHDDGSPGTIPEKFAEFQEGVRKHCPGIIVQFSTGGRSGVGSERGSMLHLRPDMASLATGSCNFPVSVYENSNELIEELASTMLEYDIKPEIEVFDLAMLYRAADLVAQGLLKQPLHVQFVLGVRNALPAHRDILEFELEKLKDLLPDATWVAAGIGKAQIEVNRWCLELGGHLRTGLEDNIRLDANTLAPSNAALVAKAAELCAEYDRHPATTKEARAILGLQMH
ncbi:MAG: 3-keto-5-aminohexanoate cleavage protein [Woeseiaceae bacterium]|nr:3-keto-5-aminohexanoate cleavage protein [Woeseiaceae bacterium]NIP21092.1 3-keto-5-aminohexanoate cleavage protein [Woeseiaceae bacterium]NIS90064.1 3-keto-5-aminohexanoate cleavage protein [Woeseiaceae bacterium]